MEELKEDDNIEEEQSEIGDIVQPLDISFIKSTKGKLILCMDNYQFFLKM